MSLLKSGIFVLNVKFQYFLSLAYEWFLVKLFFAIVGVAEVRGSIIELTQTMAYYIYNTRGFIADSTNIGEADRAVSVFTEHLGLLRVNVRAARKVSSKLRFSLSPYSLVRIALIRGKNAWRLTDAEEIVSFRGIRAERKRQLIAGVFSLVNRLVHGEGENQALFRGLEDLFGFLQREENLSDGEALITETVTACRILSALGYMGENKNVSALLSLPISKSLLDDFSPHWRGIREEIVRALRESHL